MALNRYQRSPKEFRRIVSIIKAGMNLPEIDDLLKGTKLNEFTVALNTARYSNRRSYQNYLVWRYLRDNDPVQPWVPVSDIPPASICRGCELIKNSSGLRWDKMNRGLPLTWSIDRRNEPKNTTAFSDKEIQGWFDAWTTITGAPKAVKVTNQRGDCHISFRSIDGPEKTLGFVYQPTAGEEMGVGSSLIGDMFIDSDERTWKLGKTRRVGKHEVGHVFGIGHDEKNKGSLMYGILQAITDLNPQNWDRYEFARRYPVDLLKAAEIIIKLFKK